MAVDPQSGLVLAVTNMENPENNAVAKKILIHAVSKGHQIDCIVYDRMCACYQQFGREAVLKQIKFWCVDRFHAQAHAPGCACSPLVHKRLHVRRRTNFCMVPKLCFSAQHQGNGVSHLPRACLCQEAQRFDPSQLQEALECIQRHEKGRTGQPCPSQACL